MAILAPNVDLGLLGPSGNYNLAVKWPFWLQMWTWAFWCLLAIRIWLWNGHFGSKCGPGPFGAFWQLQFGCEMAILAPNVDLGLLEPSGNYNLAVKWPFWLQMWTWAFWCLLAIRIWLWNGHFGSKCGPGPFGAFWQLQFGHEMAILAPNLERGPLKGSKRHQKRQKAPKDTKKLPKGLKKVPKGSKRLNWPLKAKLAGTVREAKNHGV